MKSGVCKKFNCLQINKQGILIGKLISGMGVYLAHESTQKGKLPFSGLQLNRQSALQNLLMDVNLVYLVRNRLFA